MKTSERLDRLPPYLFAELERKIAEKKAAGVDVISLGIGDPDTPTPELVADALAAAARRPGHPPVPVQPRPRPSCARRSRASTTAASASRSTPRPRSSRRSGAKECVFNLNLAFLDPGTCALAADPGYPVYTGGPLLAGAEAVLMPLVPELRLRARPRRDLAPRTRERRAADVPQLPEQPDRRVVPDGLFERGRGVRARQHDVLVVHDASYTETTFDGYVAPSFLETPGAKEVGVEVFSLSKGYNMTGWRTAAIVGNADAVERLLEAEDQHRLGHVRGGAAGRGGRARRGRRRAEAR